MEGVTCVDESSPLSTTCLLSFWSSQVHADCSFKKHPDQAGFLPPRPQGVIPTAQRAAIVVGVELPVYDITKKHLLRSGVMGDTILTHFM